jgi:hypothetical protein
MTTFNYAMSEEQARRIHKLAESEMFALKNHTAMYVEQGNLEKAQECVKELRAQQAIFAAFNIDAKYDIAKYCGKPLVTTETVADSRS